MKQLSMPVASDKAQKEAEIIQQVSVNSTDTQHFQFYNAFFFDNFVKSSK